MKGWLIVKKQEMTKLLVWNKFQPVTLLKIVPQEVVRQKNKEKDWYDAIVVWSGKKVLDKVKWIKEKFAYMTEFKIDQSFAETYKQWTQLNLSTLEWIEVVTIRWISKGKWFQWVVKRHNFAGWPETHGSKFHRLPWSIGNRKPRRVNKWHPLPGRMWSDLITLKNIKILQKFEFDWEQLIAVKWSLPGAYNGYLKIELN